MARFVSVLVFALVPSLHAAISGSVFSGGAPVENARVAIYRSESLLEHRERVSVGRERDALVSAKTDANGGFSIDPKLDGVFEVHVIRDGYAPERTMVLAGGGELAIDLQPAAMRTGRVTAAGKGVKDAVVIAQTATSASWSTRSDEKGSFAIPDPKGWVSELIVVHPDFAIGKIDPDTNASLELVLNGGASVSGRVLGSDRRPAAKVRLYADTWPVGTTRDDGTFTIAHLASDVETIVALSATEHGSGSRAAKNLEIRLEPSASISGVVRDSKERPLAGARVIAWPAAREVGWSDARTAVADEKGNYRIEHCASRAYNISAEAADLEFDAAQANLRGKRTDRADFTAKARTYLRGSVVDEQKRPVAGARVQLIVAQMPVTYAFLNESAATAGATTARDGGFRIPIAEQIAQYGRVLPLRVQALHPRYAAGVTGEIKLDAKDAPLTITLRDGIEVRGVVTTKDGKSVAAAGVVALQDPFGAVALPLDALLSSGNAQPFVASDAEGKFTLHLNDAPHDLSVWKQGFAAARLGGITPAAGQEALKIVLDRGTEIRGRIVAKQTGAAISGMIVAQSESGYVMGEVREDGSFVVASLIAGPYTLHYRNEKGKSLEKEVTAPATDVLLELPATGEIRGRVTDKSTGRALPEFTIDAESDSESFDGVESFSLAVAPGSAKVTAKAEGYIAETQQVTVDLDKPAEVSFALTRGRTISGRVTTEGGLPVADARVSIDDDDISDFQFTESGDDGEFELPGVVRETVKLEIQKAGYVSRELEVEGNADQRVTVVLSAGRKASGHVITATGEPVEGADVWAYGGSPASGQNAKSAADGSFTMEGLSDGRYSFRASRADLGQVEAEDIDPAEKPVVLTFAPSKGAGAIHGSVKGFIDRGWTYGSVSAGSDVQAMIRRDGTYRIDKAPAGEVEVRAQAMTQRSHVTSAAVKAIVVADGDVEVNLAFRTDITVRGIVTEDGKPAARRLIMFSSSDETMSRTQTDERGAYEIVGLEPGMYGVTVSTSSDRTFTTRYQMSSSATFDIAIVFAQLVGRAVDETGAPQADVSIEVKNSDTNDEQTVTTGVDGAFMAKVTDAKGYVVTATKKGFATAVQKVETTRTPVVMRLMRSGGLHVRLTDARNGKTLDGYVVATNETGLIAGKASEKEKDGSLPVPLAPGAYRVSVSANGFASQSVRINVPYNGELRMPLTPGGNLIVRSERASADLVKLVMPGGEEYVRCQCNGIAEIRLSGTSTTIDHVAPGRYTMQVLDHEGRIKTSYPVTIEEGQTTIAEIHIPE